MIHATRAAHSNSLKPYEPGAFSAPLNPLYRQICNGREMLVNGSFRYRSFDKDKVLPYGWKTTGTAAVSVAAPSAKPHPPG